MSLIARLILGMCYTCRVLFNISFVVYDGGTNFDDAAGNFDDREGLFDGDGVDAITVKAFIRTTDDDPSGSPTWSDWREFVVGDYKARGFDFKIEVESELESHQIQIDALSATVDVPDRTEHFEDEAIASGGTTLTYEKPFTGKPVFFSTIQSAQEGDTITYTHVTSGGKYTGVTVQVLNGGGVARTIDIKAVAY